MFLRECPELGSELLAAVSAAGNPCRVIRELTEPAPT